MFVLLIFVMSAVMTACGNRVGGQTHRRPV